MQHLMQDGERLGEKDIMHIVAWCNRQIWITSDYVASTEQGLDS